MSAVFVLHLLAPGGAEASGGLPKHRLTVSFDVENGTLFGLSEMELPDKAEYFVNAGGLKIKSAEIDERPVVKIPADGIFRVSGKGVLRVLYEGEFKGGFKASASNMGVVDKGIISPEGISLTGGWYPQIEGMAHYGLKAIVPMGFVAVSEAEEIRVEETPEGRVYMFDYPHPAPGINLAAGRYTEFKDEYEGTEIYAYFFEEDEALAEKYLKYTKKYLKTYTGLLGPFPAGRFSIVENILSTGYSMPTFTLIGKEVLRLPFIVETSLGHEILHQWFGNYVYADYTRGNWTEGLTTYLSDHMYEEEKGAGWLYRKKSLVDYRSHVNPENEISLKEFLFRADLPSKAVGYGKGMMLFHMLKDLIGEDAFFAALRGLIAEGPYSATSWEDLRRGFEKASGEDLRWFFVQWVERKGAPDIRVENARSVFLDGLPAVSFDIVQGGEIYRLGLPVKIIASSGEISLTLDVEKEREGFRIKTGGGDPVALIVDGDYDLMRTVSEKESPAVISALAGDKSPVVLVPEDGAERYDSLVEVFKAEGFSEKAEKEAKDSDLRSSSVLVFGYGGPVLKRLFGKLAVPEGGFSFSVFKNPLNPSKVVAVASASSKEEVDAAARKVFRYGSYSYLEFEGGRNTAKAADESERGLRVDLSAPVYGVRPTEKIPLERIIEDVADKDVIYVGESHTNYEDHKVQLEVIRALHARGANFAIGMEMFQRRFQAALDDYISGRTEEKEFLKASEYFKRWGFNYHLYKEIMDFARANKIPVVALNQKTEVIRKVTAGGLDSLSEEERSSVPVDMDMSDYGYKERLRNVFGKHEGAERLDFENFYQSQVLWDETMAHAADDFLRGGEGRKMVVLAGVGHLMFGSGIPKRVHRLNGLGYAIIINSNIETLDSDIADYVLFPKPLALPPQPLLMVLLKKTEKGVAVEGFSEGSVSERAGIRKGDVLVSVDGLKVADVDDVKIALYDKKAGDAVRVRVLRERFLLGGREHEFDVVL